MEIKLHEIKVRDLANGYLDNPEDGSVVGYDGKLNIRPPYQREFVYNDSQRQAVIETITKNFPLNVMYWAKCDDGTFEVIDGQQRTISVCQYVNGDFSFKTRYFHNLQDDEKEQILNYTLSIYICEGTDSEKLAWFETINIAGEKLSAQELRNAVFHGTWVSDAKRYFSKPGCAAMKIGYDYLNGSAIRQDYLETAISWISKGKIKDYMGTHQHDLNAVALWNYFCSVINWVKAIFPKYRKEMKGVNWGNLYELYSKKTWDATEIDKEVSRLMADSDVKTKKGIYQYVFDHDEHHLDIRAFDENTKREIYEKQEGYCKKCGEHFELSQMEADHITPWRDGGRTIAENCQMLCKECNRRKGAK